MKRERAVHPNSMAARKWGRTTWTTSTNRADLPAAAGPRHVGGTAAGGIPITTRAYARTQLCPACGAAAARTCINPDGTARMRQHQERHTAAIAAGYPIVKVIQRKRPAQRSGGARDKR